MLKRILFLFFLFSIPYSLFSNSVSAQITGPTIGAITVQTPGNIEKYARFEISFNITNSTNTNPYFPYEQSVPPGVETGTGITVDGLFLPPGETDWSNAKKLPCFYFQPYEERGGGSGIGLVPVGKADWRCRFTPEIAGVWQYKIQATDANGTSENQINQFTVADSNRKGFIRVSQSDPRFFEYSDGTPFTTPLINVEQGNPFNTLTSIRTNIPKMGNDGIRFVRWFPTGEGANFMTTVFGDRLEITWGFGSAWSTINDVDTALGKLFSFTPYYYTGQSVPAVPNATYRLSFRAKVTGERVLRPEIGNLSGGRMDICSATSTYHESLGNVCNDKSTDWKDYSIIVTNNASNNIYVYMRGLYVSTDAPSPFNTNQAGSIRIHSMQFQRDETGNGDWGANLLQRGDPDTYKYVDQVNSAKLDEIFKLSEQYGLYHKLTVFHKNDAILNRFQPDGTIGNWYQCSWGRCPNNFYSAPGQAARWYENAYIRYFIARWSYSPSIHSVEIGNENDITTEAYNASFDFAQYFKTLSPHPILMSNSFWGYWVETFWTDPTRGYLMDYSDKHWYGNRTSTNWEVVSNTWNDSAKYVRECWKRFKEYKTSFNYSKPIVRGEGGTTQSGTEPQDPEIAADPTGTYYRKKLWAHVGILGYSCDGDWYPRLFVTGGAFPNANFDLPKMFSAYEKFMAGEPINNGQYQEIGTDLTGAEQITIANQTGSIRAWGSRDGVNGKALLWIDNASHTWKNVVDGVAIFPASADLTIQGLPQGTYQGEEWDTQTGTAVNNKTYTVDASGALTIAVSSLSSDYALKLTNQSLSTPTPTQGLPTGTPPTPTPPPVHCTPLGDIDCSGQVGILDLSTLLANFGKKTGDAGFNLKTDLDNSGEITILDLSTLLSNFGKNGN